MIAILIAVGSCVIACIAAFACFNRSNNILGGFILLLGAAALIGGIASYPHVNVWQRGLAGEAALRQAEMDRQITVREAQAKRDSAKLLAEAEIERAKGVAEANQIIADGLGGAEGYLRYLWIQQLGENGSDVIYIPTEAGIPILEAGKRP